MFFSPLLRNPKDESKCLVATACVETKGLPHNYPELNALRAFRDGYVQKLQNGEQIISEYYSIAPRIIEGISKSETPKEVYATLYEKLDTTLKLVEAEQITFDELLKEGLKTINEVKKKYL